MSFTLVSPPITEPVSLDKLKKHFHLSTTDEDEILSTYISAAREQFEHITDWRCVLSQTWQQHIANWADPIVLLRANVTSVSSITYVNEDEEAIELTNDEETNFRFDITGCPGLVWLDDYPSLSRKVFRPITIEYVVGWQTVEAVPADIKLAIFELAAHYFNVREAYSEMEYKPVPMGFRNFCAKYNTGLGGF